MTVTLGGTQLDPTNDPVSFLRETITRVVRGQERERNKLRDIHAYMRGDSHDIYMPKGASQEYRLLVDQSRFNILPLVVSVLAQQLYVSGYRPSGASENSPVWDQVWQPNRMDARQNGLFRSAITYGPSYSVVLPDRSGQGRPPEIKNYSARDCIPWYDDDDEWPESAIIIDGPKSAHDPFLGGVVAQGTKIRLLDSTYVWRLRKAEDWEVLGVEEHGLGVCPVVRYLNNYGNLDGDCVGEIEPLLPIQRQLNQTTFGLMMAQQYAAFRQRWVTGMAIETDPNGAPAEPFNAAVNRMFQAESPETKFGEFGQTDLKGYLDSRDKTILFVSSVAQIPPHTLLVGSGISNLSAEALVALEAGMRHKITEKQTSFGESVEQTMRLAGRAMGDETIWEDTSAQVVWRDTTPRSLAQVADALGKLAVQLQIPPRALWDRIPGVTDTDIARWEAMAGTDDFLARIEETFNTTGGGEADGISTGDPVDQAA